MEDGNYALDEINDMVPGAITIEAHMATQKIRIKIDDPNYRVRFYIGELYKIFGFDYQDTLLVGSNIAPHKADITAGIESIIIHSDLVDRHSSYHNNGQIGATSNVLYSISPPSVPPSTLYNVVDPGTAYEVLVNKHVIDSIRFWMTDQRGRQINNLGEHVSYHILIKEQR